MRSSGYLARHASCIANLALLGVSLPRVGPHAVTCGGLFLSSRLEAAKPVDAVAAGTELALGSSISPAETEPGKVPVVTLNVRLPKPLHKTLRQSALTRKRPSMRF